MGKKDLETLKKNGDDTYRLGDVWGISGVEKTYEEVLRGDDGGIAAAEREVNGADALDFVADADAVAAEDALVRVPLQRRVRRAGPGGELF